MTSIVDRINAYPVDLSTVRFHIGRGTYALGPPPHKQAWRQAPESQCSDRALMDVQHGRAPSAHARALVVHPELVASRQAFRRARDRFDLTELVSQPHQERRATPPMRDPRPEALGSPGVADSSSTSFETSGSASGARLSDRE